MTTIMRGRPMTRADLTREASRLRAVAQGHRDRGDWQPSAYQRDGWHEWGAQFDGLADALDAAPAGSRYRWDHGRVSVESPEQA